MLDDPDSSLVESSYKNIYFVRRASQSWIRHVRMQLVNVNAGLKGLVGGTKLNEYAPYKCAKKSMINLFVKSMVDANGMI